nr:MAG TPA: hypothetical protein [Caudoviricetes sp.]
MLRFVPLYRRAGAIFSFPVTYFLPLFVFDLYIY